MSHCVFILGAGASAPSGCPVMANFFSAAERLHRQVIVTPEANPDDASSLIYRDLHQFREYISGQQGHVFIDHNNIESLFNFIEISTIIGHAGRYSHDDLIDIRQKFVAILCNTIFKTQEFHLTDYPGKTKIFEKATQSYQQFKKILPQTGSFWNDTPIIHVSGYSSLAYFIKYLLEQNITSDIITFNYDLGVEIALGSHSIDFHYEDDRATNDQSVGLYKLHGSLNWQIDPSSGDLVPGKTSQFRITDLESASGVLEVNTRSGICKIQSDKILKEGSLPGIVPPVESKSEARKSLNAIWKSAAESIRKSTALTIAGYSMPATDEFFKHFLLSASVDKTPLRNVFICDRNGDTRSRIKSLLSPNLRSLLGNRISELGDFVKLPDAIAQAYVNAGEII